VNAGQFLQWHDLFAVIDDGTISLPRYGVIEAALHEQAKMFPKGVAALGILPPDARPPPDDMKQAVKRVLNHWAPHLSCLAYLVEGTGFKGVAARATLVGMKIFASRPYPIYVEVTLHDTLRQILPHLHHGRTVTSDVNMLAKMIADARMGPITPTSTLSQDSYTVK
jgi:hypothetical protein